MVDMMVSHTYAGPPRGSAEEEEKRDEKEDEDNKNTSKRRRSKHCVLERKYARLRCPKPLAFD